MPLVKARTSERNGNDETHCVDCVRTVHKTANVLDKLPKSVQPTAKADLREVWMAPDRAMAEAAIATFVEKYGAKYQKAASCLLKDRDALLTFYDFPAEHWDHLRTSDEMDKRFRRSPVIFLPRGRPRGEERGIG